MEERGIPRVAFGKTGVMVTRVGLGGEGVLRTHGREGDAEAVIETALAEGIAYFDCARAYAGSEGYYGRTWRKRPAEREGVFQCGKSAVRDAEGAALQLESTLSVMGISYLDLWQIHDVRTASDIREIEGPGGALHAFTAAREAGKVRFIGVTGHHDPAVLARVVREWPVDAVMFPVNPAEEVLGGFCDETLDAALAKGIAVIGMKALGGGEFPRLKVPPELLIRYALSGAVTAVVVGCGNAEEVRLLARSGREAEIMDPQTARSLVSAFRPHARRLAWYRGAA